MLFECADCLEISGDFKVNFFRHFLDDFFPLSRGPILRAFQRIIELRNLAVHRGSLARTREILFILRDCKKFATIFLEDEKLCEYIEDIVLKIKSVEMKLTDDINIRRMTFRRDGARERDARKFSILRESRWNEEDDLALVAGEELVDFVNETLSEEKRVVIQI